MIILLMILGFSSLPSVSQSHKTIDLEEIPQKKIRKYLVSRSFDQMNDFSSIHASWKKDIDASDYNVIEKTFYLKNKLSNVWDFYRHINPVKMCNGRSIQFGLLISKPTNSVIYTNNPYLPEIDTGQVYFLNIRLMKGLFNIPVAFEIINIDQKQQIVEFSYIDNNKSLGKQTIQFFDNGEGRTKIVHRSYFKSESSLRDNLLYPHFHKKFIKDFHRNIKQLIKSNKLTFPILN
ncbi:MAG: hypothetical protein NTW82_10905 [Bacteroidia bacterium]|nr:hypothetical protein [Bacteroidia bacterium]